MGRSLSKERARVLKGMGFLRPEHGCSIHHWVRHTCDHIGRLNSVARVVPENDGRWLAICRHLSWPYGEDRRQTFPDPITAAIWIELELSQEAGV